MESAKTGAGSRLQAFPAVLILGGLVILAAGCQSQSAGPAIPPEYTAAAQAPSTLMEGDVVRVAFPGAPELDADQQVRRDGRIALPMVGEVVAAGKTPAQFERELTELFAPHLVQKEVRVTIVSSTFPVYVTGAVVRPGRITSDRPLTALEAVMEAGGFDYARANLAAVTVIRHEEGVAKHFTLNLKLVLEGKDTTPFYLKPSDIVYIPERFSWF